jgi:hypothetical protein
MPPQIYRIHLLYLTNRLAPTIALQMVFDENSLASCLAVGYEFPSVRAPVTRSESFVDGDPSKHS